MEIKLVPIKRKTFQLFKMYQGEGLEFFLKSRITYMINKVQNM